MAELTGLGDYGVGAGINFSNKVASSNAYAGDALKTMLMTPP